MDPYLEAPDTFPGVPGALAMRMQAALNARLPARYVARARRDAELHELADEELQESAEPDVVVAEPRSPSGVATLGAPVTTRLPLVHRQGRWSVKISNAQRQLITVIEILVPSIKESGKDRKTYLLKRNEYLGMGINLVEIPVPLDSGLSPVELSLQACFNEVYDESRFRTEVNYAGPPEPPLEEPDATWARELLIPYLAQRN
jgi:hypothetical protein